MSATAAGPMRTHHQAAVDDLAGRSSGPLSTGVALAAAVVGAVGLSTGQALGARGWPLVLAAPVIVLLALRGTAAQRWIAWPILAVGLISPHLHMRWPAPLLGLAAVGCLLDLGLMLAATTVLGRQGSALVTAGGCALARVTAEMAWSLTPFGDAFSWGQHLLDWLLIAQAAALVGLAGLGFGLVLLTAGVTILAIDSERPTARRTTGLGLAILALATGHGANRLEQRSGETILVTALSGGADGVQGLLEETAAAGSDLAEVVVWPEAALPAEALGRRELRRQLALTALEHSLWVVASTWDTASGQGRSYLVEPGGVLDDRQPYAQHRGPRLTELRPAVEQPAPRITTFGGLARLIGDDLLDAGLARENCRRGATVVAVSASAERSISDDQLLLARARAVANTFVVVLASDSGPAAIIDPFGRVVAEINAARQPRYRLTAEVPLVREIQPGITLRAAFGRAAALLLLGLLLWRPRTSGWDMGPWEPLYRYDG